MTTDIWAVGPFPPKRLFPSTAEQRRPTYSRQANDTFPLNYVGISQSSARPWTKQYQLCRAPIYKLMGLSRCVL